MPGNVRVPETVICSRSMVRSSAWVRMAFAERILPRASGLWVQASPDYKPRLQQRFFPEGIAFDGSRFNRTAVTAPLFSYLAAKNDVVEEVVSPEGIEPSTNRLRVCCSAS